MRISDWSEDVCSSDLATKPVVEIAVLGRFRLILDLFEIVHHRRAEELEVLGRKHRPGTRRFGSGGFVLCHVRSPAGRAYANWFIVLWAPPAFNAASPAKYSLWSSPMGSEEHTSELQSLMRISYAVFCLKKKKY